MSRKHLQASLLLLLLLISACGQKESKERMKDVCGISLPKGASVVQDKIVEAGEFYNLQYTVRLSDEETQHFVQEIRASKRYNVSGTEENNKWVQSGKGYSFYLAKKGIYYTVEVDTLEGVVSYSEAG